MAALTKRLLPLLLPAFVACTAHADEGMAACSAIADDFARLGYYDRLARGVEAGPQAGQADARDAVIERCRNDMGELGASIYLAKSGSL